MLAAQEWPSHRLETVMESIIDYRGKTPTKQPFGVPLVTAKIIKGGRISEPAEFIAIEDYDSWMRRGIPQSGDVVLTTEAPLGEVAQLDERKIALAQRVITLRGKSQILDNTFLKFLLQSSPIQHQLESRASGTTVKGIKQSELRKIQLPLPPLPEQKAIAHILGTLDDRIELNRQTNKTLEAMARAIFKSWFVDFAPVHAKRAKQGGGQCDATAAALSLSPDILDLFPDSFQDSELGEIPAGWDVGEIGDIGQNVRDSISADNIKSNDNYIALEHMPRKSISISEWATGDVVTSNKSRFSKGDILFGKLRPYFHKVGLATIDGVCSTDILVCRASSNNLNELLLMTLSSDEVVEHATAVSTGTRMPRASWKDLSTYAMAIPPDAVSERFGKYVRPMLEKIEANIPESQYLSNLRDTLLPKLISGQLRIKEAEKFLKEAPL